MARQSKAAFFWIVGLLRKQKIPFQITGGMAARAYGSNRPLADIDIEVRDDAVYRIQKEAAQYAIYGPKHYKNKPFDLLLMTLKYKGQEIDICGIDSQKLFNSKTKRWIAQHIELDKAKRKKINGIFVPVVPMEDLISYKRIIQRDVDLLDIHALSSS